MLKSNTKEKKGAEDEQTISSNHKMVLECNRSQSGIETDEKRNTKARRQTKSDGEKLRKTDSKEQHNEPIDGGARG